MKRSREMDDFIVDDDMSCMSDDSDSESEYSDSDSDSDYEIELIEVTSYRIRKSQRESKRIKIDQYNVFELTKAELISHIIGVQCMYGRDVDYKPRRNTPQKNTSWLLKNAPAIYYAGKVIANKPTSRWNRNIGISY